MDIHELFARAEPSLKTQVDRVKFFGWYLHLHRGRERFSQTDVKNLYNQLNIDCPPSLGGWFTSLLDQRQLLKDAGGYRLERSVRDQFTKTFGGTAEKPTTPVVKSLEALVGNVIDPAERGFIAEAITCIKHSAPRAAIVLGWCAAIHRLRKKVETGGFDLFNAASVRLKNQTSGKYKHWNKSFNVTSLGELQRTVFDSDLIIVLEGMGFIDGTQAQRLETCFEYRCHSAHPGEAPIEEAHVVAFFTDITGIILANPTFARAQPSAAGASVPAATA